MSVKWPTCVGYAMVQVVWWTHQELRAISAQKKYQNNTGINIEPVSQNSCAKQVLPVLHVGVMPTAAERCSPIAS